MQLGSTHKHPVIVAAPVGFERCPTTIVDFGEMLHHVTHIFAVGELARAWHSKDVGPGQIVDPLERGVGGIARISHHHDLTHPRRGLAVFKHLTEHDILVPLPFGINGSDGYRNAKAIPTGDSHHHAKAKGVRGRFTLTGHQTQGMFAPSLGFVRGVTDEVEAPIGRGW